MSSAETTLVSLYEKLPAYVVGGGPGIRKRTGSFVKSRDATSARCLTPSPSSPW